MIALAGGTFRMGSDRHYPEEAPVHAATVGPFEIDPTPVTNAEFGNFVAATGYVTLAERTPAMADYPGADPALLVAGSAVFTVPTALPRGPADWWDYRPGAHWRFPQEDGRPAEPRHPVVHVALADAAAYAAWAGKSLPTETEWEFAAWGGRDDGEYAWGDDFLPGGVPQANTWHGRFPLERRSADDFSRTSVVTSFPANAYGLFDMIGNVWEWTVTPWNTDQPVRACCSSDASSALAYAIKGGSHLCAPNYCRRYRPAARQPQSADSPTSHIGFRCIRRLEHIDKEQLDPTDSVRSDVALGRRRREVTRRAQPGRLGAIDGDDGAVDVAGGGRQ